MMVGIDVTHPSPGSTSGAPSVAAMVASVNKRLGQWPVILSIQKEARAEMGKQPQPLSPLFHPLPVGKPAHALTNAHAILPHSNEPQKHAQDAPRALAEEPEARFPTGEHPRVPGRGFRG